MFCPGSMYVCDGQWVQTRMKERSASMEDRTMGRILLKMYSSFLWLSGSSSWEVRGSGASTGLDGLKSWGEGGGVPTWRWMMQAKRAMVVWGSFRSFQLSGLLDDLEWWNTFRLDHFWLARSASSNMSAFVSPWGVKFSESTFVFELSWSVDVREQAASSEVLIVQEQQPLEFRYDWVC
jgi:hypothetical protein